MARDLHAISGAGARAGSPRARRLAEARENRRLRRLVARLHGCLGSLHPRERRLLALRVGLHGPARSAQATARILHVTLRRETVLEARAITALTRAAATGCAGSPAAIAKALSAAGVTPAGLTPAGVTRSSVTAATGVTATPAPSAKLTGAHGSRSLQRSGDVSPLAGRSASGTDKAQTGGSFPSAIVSALAGLLLALAMVIVPKLRRRPQAAAAGSVALHGADSPFLAATPSASESAPGGPGVGSRNVPFRRMTGPMDPVIAPMAADAYTSMADENHGNPEGSADEAQGGEAPGGT